MDKYFSKIKIKSFDDGDQDTPYHHPSLPCVKVLEREDLCDDGGDTSDEDINCNESDFMTMAEFLEAYRTNVDLGQNDVNLKISHSEHQGRAEGHEEEEEAETSTQSECESLGSVSGEELDSLEDNVTHSADCINLERIEHSEDCIYRKGDSFYTGQEILIQAEPELPEDKEEDLTDEEKTCISEVNEVGPDMTDEELVSDVERSTKSDPRQTNTIELPVGRRRSRVKKRGNKNKKRKNETNN